MNEIISQLQTKIGAEIHVSTWFEITQARVDEFARATGAHQWIHNDPGRAARESPYGAPIAHGYLILSLYPTLRELLATYPGMTTVINYGLNKCRFPQAVRVGRRIRAHSRLLSVEAVTGGLQTIEQFTVGIEGETKPACVAEVIIRFLPTRA